MKGTLSNVLIFAVGAAIGSAVTYRLVKGKYERIADDEIESMREHFARKAEREAKIEEPDEVDDMPDETETEYESVAKKYMSDSEPVFLNKNKGEKRMNKPCIITPDEFGEDADYDTASLTYYADGVLADEMDEIIENADEIVGEDFAVHFGDYDGDDDSVFVRNDDRRCYYEILRDSRPYPYAGR